MPESNETRRTRIAEKHGVSLSDLDDLLYNIENGRVAITALPERSGGSSRANINAELSLYKAVELLNLLKNRLEGRGGL